MRREDDEPLKYYDYFIEKERVIKESNKEN